MAEIHPFRGIRYQPGLAAQHGELLCPPYDAIGPKELFRYYLRHPYNAVRLELGQETPEDDVVDNRHVRAASTFRQWLQEGVLRQDEIPSLYLHEQSYRGRVRRGLIGLVRLDSAILPHKAPHADRLAERLALIKSAQSNFSPLLGLYEDPDQIVAERTIEATSQAPFLEVTDDAGGRHRLWKVISPDLIDEVQAVLRDRPIYLADGHNRFLAARAYCDQLNQQGADPDRGLHNFVLMELVDLEDPALHLDPWHRLVRAEGLEASFKEQLTEWFEVTPWRIDPDQPFPEQVEAILAEQQAADAPRRFGMILANDLTYYWLTPKPTVKLDWGDPVAAWGRLDSAWVDQLILDRLLAIPEPLRQGTGTVAYARDPREVLVGIGSGQFNLAFLLNPPPVDALTTVAAAGRTVPRRTVDLIPKLPTGLVMHHLEGTLS